MKDIFKVAMLQMERSSDINNNIKKGIKFCKNAKLMGADIAVFPEMWSNGYEILFRGLLKNQKIASKLAPTECDHVFLIGHGMTLCIARVVKLDCVPH